MNFKSRILILLIFITSILVVGCSNNKVNNTKSENQCVVEENIVELVNSINLPQAIKLPEQVIKDSFKYKNLHQLKSLLTCYTKRYENVNFRLDNLESCKLESLELITDEKIYKSYFTSGRGMVNHIERENVRKYTVKYNVQYKDQSKEPIDSGDYETTYTLIRENNLGEWKIDGIGES